MIISAYATIHDSKLWTNGIFMSPLNTNHTYLKNTFLVSILLSCIASAYCLMSFVIEMLIGIREMNYIPSFFDPQYYKVLLITILMVGGCFVPYQYLAELSAVFGSIAMLIQLFAWNKMDHYTHSLICKRVCILSLTIISLFSICSLDLFSLYVSLCSFFILSFTYLLYTFCSNASDDFTTICQKIQRNRKTNYTPCPNQECKYQYKIVDKTHTKVQNI